MTQEQFDKDLKGDINDALGLTGFPEQEEGFEDNPIRLAFEQVQKSEENDG